MLKCCVKGHLTILNIPSTYHLFASANNWICFCVANTKWYLSPTLISDFIKLAGMCLSLISKVRLMGCAGLVAHCFLFARWVRFSGAGSKAVGIVGSLFSSITSSMISYAGQNTSSIALSLINFDTLLVVTGHASRGWECSLDPLIKTLFTSFIVIPQLTVLLHTAHCQWKPTLFSPLKVYA